MMQDELNDDDSIEYFNENLYGTDSGEEAKDWTKSAVFWIHDCQSLRIALDIG
jgi:hypothetical protein